MILRRIWSRLIACFDDPSTAQLWRHDLLGRWLGMGGLALVAATWRLWTPQTIFPRVPLCSFWDGFSATGEWLLLVLLLVALFALVVLPKLPRWRTLALAIVALTLVLLIAGDQHRAQPWAYQLIVVSCLWAAVTPWRGVVLLRLLVVSIYLYSAVAKLDYAFLTTLGPQFRDALLHLVGMSAERWPSGVRALANSAFPIGELLIALLLCFARTRVAGLLGSLLMHALMMILLSPWGLDHQPGVLVWNIYFLGQNVLLFGGTLRAGNLKKSQPSQQESRDARRPTTDAATEEASSEQQRWTSPVGRFASIVVEIGVGWVLFWPLLEPWGYCETWLAWGLYAPRAERTTVLIQDRDREQLPAQLQPYLEATEEEGGWWRLRIDQWSLDALQAPIYPQNRVQIGVALAVAAEPALDGRLRVVAFTKANRLTGERQYREYFGEAELRTATTKYWLRSWPRAAE